MTAEELIAFEDEVAAAFEAKKIYGPVHLAGGNEAQLIEIFKEVRREDWVLSTWRSHYHALLHGVPRETVMAEILSGRSMSLHFPEYRFMTSAIAGGILPIACGLAYGGETIWCFVGDMVASTGVFKDALKFAHCNALDVQFVVEDNGLSVNTPTREAWGVQIALPRIRKYEYQRTRPHCGSGNFVTF